MSFQERKRKLAPPTPPLLPAFVANVMASELESMIAKEGTRIIEQLPSFHRLHLNTVVSGDMTTANRLTVERICCGYFKAAETIKATIKYNHRVYHNLHLKRRMWGPKIRCER